MKVTPFNRYIDHCNIRILRVFNHRIILSYPSSWLKLWHADGRTAIQMPWIPTWPSHLKIHQVSLVVNVVNIPHVRQRANNHQCRNSDTFWLKVSRYLCMYGHRCVLPFLIQEDEKKAVERRKGDFIDDGGKGGGTLGLVSTSNRNRASQEDKGKVSISQLVLYNVHEVGGISGGVYRLHFTKWTLLNFLPNPESSLYS